MKSKAIILIGLVIALSGVCLCVPAADEPGVKAVVEFVLRGAEPRPVVSAGVAREFRSLKSCYNGTFSALKQEDLNKYIDFRQEPLYRQCRANRGRLLDSLWFNADENFGAHLFMPIYFVSVFERFVAEKMLGEESLKDQLVEYRKLYNFKIEGIDHWIYIEKMVSLINTELAQWGLDQARVTDFLEDKTKQPFNKVLKVCHEAVNL